MVSGIETVYRWSQIIVQIKSKHGTATVQSMAKVATTEPWSNALLKSPTRVKCWKARNAAITNERTTPSCLPLWQPTHTLENY